MNLNIWRNYILIEFIKKLTYIENNIEEKIKLIREMAWYSTCNVTGKYSDSEMENELIKIGNRIKFNHSINPQPNTVLHVMTESYNVGGHTRVVSNWIEFDSRRQHSVVFTEQKKAIPNFLKEAVTKSGGKIYFLTGNYALKKAEQLLHISSNFEKIVLSIHTYDIIPIIAYSNKNWTTPIYFYNHSEFRFWLGVSISDIVFDLSKDDLKKSIMDRGVNRSIKLSIPLKEKYTNIQYNDDASEIYIKYNLPKNSKIVTSMASDYKYKVIDGYNFPKFINSLVEKKDNIYILIIGGDPNNDIWKKSINTGRVKVLGVLPSEEVDKILSITSVYLDSFPFPSYTCLLEAISHKIPVLSYEVKGYRLDATKPVRCKSLKLLTEKTLQYLNSSQLYQYEDVERRIEKDHYKKDWLEHMETAFSENLKHHVHSFDSNFNIGNFERLNDEVLSPKKRLKNIYFTSVSSKNKMIIKGIGRLLMIKL